MKTYTSEEFLEHVWQVEKISAMKFSEEDAKKVKGTFLGYFKRTGIQIDQRFIVCSVLLLKPYSNFFPESFYSDEFIGAAEEDTVVELDPIMERYKSIIADGYYIPEVIGLDNNCGLCQGGIYNPELNCFELRATGQKSEVFAWAEKLDIGNIFIVVDPTKDTEKPNHLVIAVAPQGYQH